MELVFDFFYSFFTSRSSEDDLYDLAEGGMAGPLKRDMCNFKVKLGQMQLQVLSDVTKRESGHASLKELEWCGTLCSAKYCTLLLPYENTANTHNQCSQKYLSQDSNVIESPINDGDISKSSLDNGREILKVTKNEIECLWKMKHGNIITMLGIYYEDCSEYMLPLLVMELVQYSLWQYIEKGYLSGWNNAFGILEGVSSGLVYLHEVNKIAHNNISERTILLTKDLVAKLSSFEYAKSIASNCYRELNKSKFSHSNCDTFADVCAFSQVMYCTVSCKHLDVCLSEKFIEPLLSFAEKCANKCLDNHPSSPEILDAIKVYSLTEKTDELKKCKEEFESKQTDLNSEVEKLKYDNERLTEKTDELKKSKEELESIQAELKNQIEKLKNDNERASEVSKVELAEKQQKDSTECKDVAVIPQQSLQNQLTKEKEALKNQLEQLEVKFLQIEERRFKLTNSFTTVDSRSPLKLSGDYRHLQQHVRAAAARAHKKLYRNCNPVPFHDHTMIAYNKAKDLILIASKQYIEKSLFDLHHQPNEGLDTGGTKDLVSVELMIEKLYDDHSLTVQSISTIKKTLTEEYERHVNQQDIPAEVKDYYTKLAELTWNAVAKAIPMVLSVEEEYYNVIIHELKDELEDDFNFTIQHRVEYIYPVLFTSNNHPREVAIKGKVKLV